MLTSVIYVKITTLTCYNCCVTVVKEINMNDYVLFVDVACDLTIDYIREHDIHLIPMTFDVKGETKTYNYGESDFTIQEFYNWVDNNVPILTTLVTPFAYEEFFRPFLEQGHSILFLCMSSGCSSTVNSAYQAARELKEEFPDLDVKVVDSLAVSGGISILAEKMVENKESGMSLEDNYMNIKELTSRSYSYAHVDSLETFKNTGRISATSAFFGGIIGIKPLVCLDEKGTVLALEQNHGVKKSLNSMVNHYVEDHSDEPNSTVYICDGCQKKIADELERRIREVNPNAVIKRTDLSPIIGGHTGPGTVLMGYWLKPGVHKGPVEESK